MISSEVKRTLVKSPPELWAELSDPVALARHLGELGEITITRTEPEKLVEWEAADATGKVLLKSSGWGTKVTLTANRELSTIASPAADDPAVTVEPPPEPAAGAPEPAVVTPVSAVDPEPLAVTEGPEPASERAATTTSSVETPPIEEPPTEEPVLAEDSEFAPRQGFFARLFRRRPKAQTPVEPALQATVEPALQATIEPEPTVETEPSPELDLAASEPAQPAALEIVAPEPASPDDAPREEAPPEDAPDIAAELKTAEEAATEEVTAVLTAALDRLGAAHHRPFSRA